MFYVIKSTLGNYLRKDAEAFTNEVREARRYSTEAGAAEAVRRYWGAIGPRVMRPTAVTIRRERD